MTNRRVGRPRVAGGFRCPRCDQTAKKHRATWPEGPICASCYVRAVETFGACASCERHGMLPGFDVDHRPICRACANISTDLDCQTCGEEAELIRRKRCARCVLREDLNALLSPNDPPDLSLKRLVAVLCSVERPASLLTWMRSPAPRALLTSIGQRELALEHQAFDYLAGGSIDPADFPRYVISTDFATIRVTDLDGDGGPASSYFPITDLRDHAEDLGFLGGYQSAAIETSDPSSARPPDSGRPSAARSRRRTGSGQRPARSASPGRRPTARA